MVRWALMEWTGICWIRWNRVGRCWHIRHSILSQDFGSTLRTRPKAKACRGDSVLSCNPSPQILRSYYGLSHPQQSIRASNIQPAFTSTSPVPIPSSTLVSCPPRLGNHPLQLVDLSLRAAERPKSLLR